ncbi:ABC transporter permease [Uliginosibacterium sediminicola]|uniref:FtsX-like permease family protein n=1 Tax=Uliginosibacterium sediminicola TaxID=2024550 RepID=A0ABU9YUI1_9RHOO
MSALLRLALSSAWNRRMALSLTLLSIMLSALLLLGVAHIRKDVRDSFSASVSGTDLVVGPRGSGLSLMLYTVFHLGDATQNMEWKSYLHLRDHAAVAWALPLSLGDSHRGFPVLATLPEYFQRFHYGDAQSLRVAAGKPFADVFDVTLGAEVARSLGYKPGDKITLTHGSGSALGAEHADKPFTVSGVLAPSGTPVDRTLFISLAGMEAIHLDWQAGAPMPGLSIPAEFVKKFDLTPKTITGVMIGLKSRAHVFAMQREIADYKDEALMGVMPGVALDQLWQVAQLGEQALLLVSIAVAAVGLAGLVATLLAGLDARRRELAILRSVGAGPRSILALLLCEGMLITVLGTLLGWLVLCLGLTLGGPFLQANYGIVTQAFIPAGDELWLLAGMLLAGLLAALVPALRAYRLSLADGLTPRI